MEVELAAVKVRMEEYLNKFNSLKRSWEEKDGELKNALALNDTYKQ